MTANIEASEAIIESFLSKYRKRLLYVSSVSETARVSTACRLLV